MYSAGPGSSATDWSTLVHILTTCSSHLTASWKLQWWSMKSLFVFIYVMFLLLSSHCSGVLLFLHNSLQSSPANYCRVFLFGSSVDGAVVPAEVHINFASLSETRRIKSVITCFFKMIVYCLLFWEDPRAPFNHSKITLILPDFSRLLLTMTLKWWHISDVHYRTRICLTSVSGTPDASCKTMDFHLPCICDWWLYFIHSKTPP